MNITEAEWVIMEILWTSHPLTLKEILETLDEDKSWSRNTVRTLLVRLMEKGLVEADKSTGHFKYAPLVEKDICQLSQTKKLINRIYKGSLGMLVKNFVTETQLTEAEKEELLRIIKEN